MTQNAVNLALQMMAQDAANRQQNVIAQQQLEAAASHTADVVKNAEGEKNNYLQVKAGGLRDKQQQLDQHKVRAAGRLTSLQGALTVANTKLTALQRQVEILKAQEQERIEKEQEQKELIAEEKAAAAKEAADEKRHRMHEKTAKAAHLKKLEAQRKADAAAAAARAKARAARRKAKAAQRRARRAAARQRRQKMLDRMRKLRKINQDKAVAAATAAAAARAFAGSQGKMADRAEAARRAALLAAAEKENLDKLQQAEKGFKRRERIRSKQLEEKLQAEHVRENRIKDKEHRRRIAGIKAEMEARKKHTLKLKAWMVKLKADLDAKKAALLAEKRALKGYIQARSRRARKRAAKLRSKLTALKGKVDDWAQNFRRLLSRRTELATNGRKKAWNGAERREFAQLPDMITAARKKFEVAQNKLNSLRQRVANLKSYRRLLRRIVSIKHGRELAKRYRQLASQERAYRRKRAASLQAKFKSMLRHERARSRKLAKDALAARTSGIKKKLTKIRNAVLKITKQLAETRGEFIKQNNRRPKRSRNAVILDYKKDFEAKYSKYRYLLGKQAKLEAKMANGPVRKISPKIKRLPAINWAN